MKFLKLRAKSICWQCGVVSLLTIEACNPFEVVVSAPRSWHLRYGLGLSRQLCGVQLGSYLVGWHQMSASVRNFVVLSLAASWWCGNSPWPQQCTSVKPR
ncbi:hypothetical protein NE237_027058 [Protea cynaroides]|uniref:Uncharacterized protein n=1 Tax=Protea cynaroides TaxID=273540 RepID=A0A9Q0GLU5_9MAGN|nr:hypothetical protein NE237_027058 [Protea cynaroides]